MTASRAQARCLMTAELMPALYPIARPTAIVRRDAKRTPKPIKGGAIASGRVAASTSRWKEHSPRPSPREERGEGEELMRGEDVRSAVRTDLRCHQALGAGAVPDQHGLTGPQFGD